MERPSPMKEYAKDITAAMMERNESLWKFGIWLRRICIIPNIIMKGLFDSWQPASWPLEWKQLDLLIALINREKNKINYEELGFCIKQKLCNKI